MCNNQNVSTRSMQDAAGELRAGALVCPVAARRSWLRSAVKSISLAVCLTLGMAVVPVANAQPQDFPSKPIRLLVPFGAGSTTDVLGRMLGNQMSKALKQPVVVENRPGAGGTIGAAAAARDAPDGYSLVTGTVASHAVAPLMMAGVKYDPVKDFTPITILASAPGVLVVHPSVPVSNVKEFVEYVKKNPGLDYASAGVGTTTHLSGEALRLAADINMSHIPYKDVGQAINDLLGGTVKAMFYQLPSVRAHIESGGLKLIATTSAQRLSTFPNVETIAETYPGYDISAWFGLFAPAGTPKPIIDRLYEVTADALDSAEFKDLLVQQGLERGGMSPDEFGRFLAADQDRWKKLIDATGTKLR